MRASAEPSPMTASTRVGQLIRAQAQRAPRALALLEPGHEPIRYGELQTSIDDLVRQLRDFGILPGHRIGLILPNASATAAIILGLLDCCTLAPFNPGYQRREYEALFRRIGVDAIVTVGGEDHPGRDCARARAIPAIEISASEQRSEQFSVELPAGPAPGKPAADDTGAAPALVLHTSGSTAEAKIVPLSQRNLLASITALIDSLQLSAADRCLNMMPMFHIGGLLDMLLAPLAVGASVVTPRANNGATFFRCLHEFSPSCYQGVPTMLRDIVNTLKSDPALIRDTQPLRLIRSVSSALPNRLLHEVETLLSTSVIEIYGMTESAGVICSNPLAADAQRQGSVGLPQRCEVRILGADGKSLETGARGEVAVRGESIMRGYEGDGAVSEFSDGFLRTGDEGYLDADGYLYLCGRIKDIINRGGEKISPLEIDRVAEAHPAVKAAAAFALPHSTLGEEVGLAIIPDPGARYDESDLNAHLEANLSAHKLPRRIFYPKKLPRAAGGKLQRFRLARLSLEQIEQAPAGRAMPESALAHQLAGLWQAVLDVEKIGMDDNFFDLGGDSLSAAAISGELQRLYPLIELSGIYEYPTLRQLEQYLRERMDGTAVTGEPALGEFEISASVLPFMGAWQGSRLDRDSLIVGRNTDGNRTPLFWCVNGFSEFDALARQLHVDQPVYGMRSLYETGYKSDAATLRLARLYHDELLQIQPRGPYLVGGFCEGGKIAFLLAQLLRERGDTVATLMLQEQFVASPYGGRVAIFVCKPGRNNPYFNFTDAARGWRKYYSGDLQLYKINGRHKDCYLRPDIEFVARQIEREIQRALSYRHDDTIDRRNRLQRLPLDAYRASLRASPPTRVRPGASFDVDVEVTNDSSFDWMPTPASGLVLGARWLRPDGRIRTWMAGVSDIPRLLHPGESVNLPIRVRAPLRLQPFCLELDMVDDGVSWFNDMGSEPSRHLVDISIFGT